MTEPGLGTTATTQDVWDDVRRTTSSSNVPGVMPRLILDSVSPFIATAATPPWLVDRTSEEIRGCRPNHCRAMSLRETGHQPDDHDELPAGRSIYWRVSGC